VFVPGGDPGDAGAEASERDTVPLSALKMPDDQEQMTPPEVGDEVNYQVTGKVVSINGDQAVIERETINGQPFDPGQNLCLIRDWQFVQAVQERATSVFQPDTAKRQVHIISFMICCQPPDG